MTSNLGAQYLSELPPDQPSSVARDDVMRVVRAHFAPEFINRQVLLRLLLACVCMRMCVCLTMIVSARASLCALLSVCAPSSPSPSHPSLPPSLPPSSSRNSIDNVVLFNRLKREDMDQIVQQQLNSLRSLLHERGLGLTADSSVISLLADLGYDPAYGARPLKRTMQTAVLNPLATLLLEGKAKPEDMLWLVRMRREEVKEGRDVVLFGRGAIGGGEEEGGEEWEEGGLQGLILGEDVLVCRVVEGGYVEGGENGGNGKGVVKKGGEDEGVMKEAV